MTFYGRIRTIDGIRIHNTAFIPPVLHPTCPASHLSCFPPVLHSTCPASHLSCIPPVLHSTCPTFHLSCISPVLYPTCPASLLSCTQCCGATTFLGSSSFRSPRSRSRLRLQPNWVGSRSGSRQKRAALTLAPAPDTKI